MFITTSLFSQSSIDSILMIKINLYRKSLGLNELKFDSKLSECSKIQSDFLLDTNRILNNNGIIKRTFVSHVNNFIKFKFLEDRYKYISKNKYTSLAECVHVGGTLFGSDDLDTNDIDLITDIIIDGWKNSSEHNKILLGDYLSYGSYTNIIQFKSGLKVVNDRSIKYMKSKNLYIGKDISLITIPISVIVLSN